MPIWILLFLSVVLVSSLLNWSGLKGTLLGYKGYFQIWGLGLSMYLLTKTKSEANRYMQFFLLLGLIQLPFLLHQFFVLVPQRVSEEYASYGIVAGDIVAGTFGGSMFGGGRSPSLALLSVMCITLLLARAKVNLVTLKQLVVGILFFLFPMVISQVAAFLVMLPIAVFILFKDQVLKKPLQALSATLLIGVTVFAIFFGYSLLPSATSQKAMSMSEVVEDSIAYNFGEKGYGNAKLNRTTVYAFWVKEHASYRDLMPLLFGHGLASTSGTTTLNVKGSLGASRYHGFGIGLTGISALLWEVGLLGVITVLGMFFSAYKLSSRLAKHWQDTTVGANLITCQVMIVIYGISLLHINYFVFDLSYQAMLIMIFTYLFIVARIDNTPKVAK